MNINLSNIKKAVKYLNKNECIGIPTETVYGLGGIGNSDLAIDAIYNAKNRPKKNPIIAHVKNIQEARKLGQFTKIAEIIGKNFWPGPLTLILKKIKNNLINDFSISGLDIIAVRMPNSQIFLNIIYSFDESLSLKN